MLKIYDIEYNEKRNGKNLEDRLNHFQSLVETGLPLVIYVSEIYKEAVEERCRGWPVRLVVLELADTWTYKELAKWKETIPAHRNVAKDTFEFLTLMTAKAEFMAQTAESNPFQSDKFAWVDFNVFHVLFNGFTSQEVLKGMVHCTLKSEHSFVVPGCWDKGRHLDRNTIHWRFCGGFFLATAEGIKEFFALHQKHLGSAFDGVSWEVNFWAWLEKEAGWRPSWFKAGHDSTLIEIPATFFDVQGPPAVTWLTKLEGAVTGAYTYPILENYHPTSSSFLEFQGIPFLNVRYVNYLLTPPGLYIIHDPSGHLRTENLLLRLAEDRLTQTEGHFLKTVTSLPTVDDSIRGLEDIRLYEFAGTMRIIATQRQYSPTRQNRMMIGTVDLSASALTDLVLVEPPQPTGCEKNWIPIINNGVEHFIYQWFPYQVGVLEQGRLNIVIEKAMPNLFGRIRGSTTFLEDGSERIGVVHYSEDRSPRHYYHMLVWLNKETLLPVARSQPFVFGRQGVEFCIGLGLLANQRMQFWYSQHDRDPVWSIVPRTAFARINVSS